MLLALGLVIYLLFLWQLKSSVDAFLVSQPAGLDFEYQWLVADSEGNLYLKDVDLYDNDNRLLASAKWVTVQFDSFGSMWSLDKNVLYQKLPKSLNFRVDGAHTIAQDGFFTRLNFLNIPFEPAIIPEACAEYLASPGAFSFSLQGELRYQENDEILDFSTQFQSLSFADLALTGRLDNLSSQNMQNGYLSQLSLTAENMVWLQQALNQCRETTHLTQNGQLAEHFSSQLQSIAKANQYWLEDAFITQYAQFINLPEKITFEFSPHEGMSWPQIRNLPLVDMAQNAEFQLTLNNAPVTELLSQADGLGLPILPNQTATAALPVVTNSYLPVNYRGLSSFVGTRVVIYLNNQTSVKGVIKQVSRDRLILNEFQFGGYSELPYKYADIESIEVYENR